MQYRKFGKTGETLSALGFGAMRLPVLDGDASRIDEEKALPLVRGAIDRGVNYLDTAWPYHGGASEPFCARVMKEGYREKVKIATKLPSWLIKSPADMDAYLDKQLERLEVDQIDFYLIHSLNAAYWETMQNFDYRAFLDRAKASGKIKHAGFSFHADRELFKTIVDDYDWDFCQIQLNYLDENYQAGLEGLRYAAARDLGVVIMEPLRGGMLARQDIPEALQAIWAGGKKPWSPAAWALHFLWDYKEVGIILSGMTTPEQLEDNLRTASEAAPGLLGEEEHRTLRAAKNYFHSRIEVDCTNCRYCMPCPRGVNIPEVFWARNHEALFDDYKKAKFVVTGQLREDQRPSRCNRCGACEKKCPQGIPIRRFLAEARERSEGTGA